MASVDVNSNNTIVTITQTGKEVVNIVTTGPQGPAGTQGIPGPSGSSSHTDISALNIFTGSAQTEINSLTAATGSYLTSLPSNILSSSAQISSDISGSFTASSASFSTRTTILESNPVFSAAGISGSFNVASSSFSTRVTSLEDGGGGSGFTADGISGSLGVNATLIRSLTSTNISGSFTQPSASFSTRVSTLESGGGSSFTSAGISGSWQGQNFISASQITPNLPSGTLSSSAQIASDISGAFASPFTSAGISGSFNAASSSFSTRVTTNEANITSITSSLDANRVVFTTTGGQLATDAGMTYDSTSDRLTVQSLDVVHLTSSFITASTIQTSGSNIFGDATNDVQTLIGTTKMTGSAQITGSLGITGNADIIGNISVPMNSQFKVNTYNTILTNNSLQLYGGAYISGRNSVNGSFVTIGTTTGGNSFGFARLGVKGTGLGATQHIFEAQDSSDNSIFAISNNGHITASGNISSSVTSTASFGTYLGDGSQLTGISSTPFPFSGDAQITGSLDVSGSITTFDINMSTWTLGADGGSNYYYFTGPGDLGGTEQNPDIHLTRGQKYRFYNPMNAHPFQIQDLGGSAFSTGVTNNGVQLGFLSFDVPMDGPTHLKYQCTAHAAMIGNIYIADARVASGSFSGSFQGDGSALTNLPASSPFPFTGDAQITGSLTISGSLHAFTLDSDSVILGKDAGKHAAATAENNVIIGVSAGISASNDNNVLIGKQAGEKVTGDGSDNIFIGYQSGQQGDGKEENVAIGRDALRGYASSDGSDRNVALGYYAGRLFQNSTDNIAVGYYAGHGNGSGGTSAVRNVFLGGYAGYNHWNGIQDNIYIGYYAGAFNQQGDRNIIIGSGSTANGNPSDQLRIGHSTLHVISGSLLTGDIIFASTASAEYFVGDGSNLTNLPASSPFPFTGDAQITGSLVISASNNTSESLSIEGSGSTIFSVQGSQGQLFSVTDDLLDEVFSVADISGDTLLSVSGSGLVTIPVGDLTGSATATASYGAFKGDGSQLTGISLDPFPFTGDAQITGSLTISGSLEAFTNVSTNVQIGNNAGAAFTTAANSVIIGQGAGDQITTGTSNTIIGSEAGGTVGTGILDNVFIGYAAGKENTSDSIRNVFIGYQAGYKQSGGYENVAIGYRSMANFSTTGDHDYNSALGAYTLYSINTGQYNVAIGRNAGYAINDGDNNILIGRNAGSGITYGGSNIIIGSGSLGALALEQQLRIGNGNSLVTISASLETGDIIFASTASAPNFSGSFQGNGSNLTNITAATTASYVETSNYTAAWDVVNNGSSAYRFTGNGLSSTTNNPDIFLTRGEKYLFNLNASGHPFEIRVSSGGSAYSDGVTNNGAQTGEVIFEVPFDSPNHLYYQCTNHGGMIGRIQMVGSFISSSFDMLSPDGTIFRFTVNNSGHLSVTGSSV